MSAISNTRYVIPLRYAQLCLFVYPFGNADLDISDPDRLAKTKYEVVDGSRDYVATVVGRDNVKPFLKAEVKRRKEALERQIRMEGVAVADDTSPQSSNSSPYEENERSSTPNVKDRVPSSS